MMMLKISTILVSSAFATVSPTEPVNFGTLVPAGRFAYKLSAEIADLKGKRFVRAEMINMEDKTIGPITVSLKCRDARDDDS
jgi:hypothetical protein